MRSRMHLALGRRGQAEIGGDDRLLDRMHHRLVPDLHRDRRGSGTLTVATWLSGMWVP